MINENIHESDAENLEEDVDNEIISLSNANSIRVNDNNDDDDKENIENGAKQENFYGQISLRSLENPKESLKSSDDSNPNFSTRLNKVHKNQTVKKRHLVREDLENREKSKLACLIRKKYTALMKDSILEKGVRKKSKLCDSFKKLSSNIFYELTGQIAQAFISLISVVLYVFSTYYPDYSQLSQLKGSEHTIVKFIKWFELSIAIIINIDWLVNLIKAKHKWKFISNFLNIIDVIMFTFVYVNLINSFAKNLGFIRVFRMIRIMRIFRLFKLVQVSNKDGSEERKNEINRRLISSILTILAVVFVATGIVHFLNNTFPIYFGLDIPQLNQYECQSGNDFAVNQLTPELAGVEIKLQCADGDPLVLKAGVLTFDLAFYYMVITMATVGYGDIYPNTTWMRIFIGVFVIISIITISRQTTELNDIIQMNTKYQIPYPITKGIEHVILAGFFNKSSLIRFLNEFYHIDHNEKSQHIKIVIIQNESPDKDIQSILLDPKYEENLHYINGDIFSENIMEASQAQTASGIILVSDHNHPDAAKNDQFLILACKAFSQYSQANLHVQFKYSQSLLHDWADWDIACSSSQIKMSMITINGYISGFITMMMNLSSSMSTIINVDYRKKPWMHEYINGASQEIYIVDLPENFVFSMSLTEFIWKSYLNTGSLIIGVKKKVYYQDDRDIFYYVYLLNPVDLKIENEDALIVISNDSESALSIFDPENKKYKSKSLKNLCEESRARKERDKFNYFIHNIKEENLLVSNPKTLVKKKSNENIKENEKRVSTTWERNDSFHLNPNKNNIPNIFREQQHFKIWENNPEELGSYFLDHYLIFCKEEHLWEFMKSFDAFYSDIIFFVCDHHPSSQWEILVKSFRNLIFIECSYSDFDDLQKLGLEEAKHVFILSYAVENSNVGDSAILPLVKILEENYPKCKYTLELTDEINLQYLNNEGDFDGDLNLLDDSKRSSLKERDIQKKKKKEKLNSQIIKFPVRLWPKYAKGDIFFSSSLDSLMAFGFHNNGVLEVIMKLLGLNSVIKNKNIIENSNIGMLRYVGIRKSYTYKNIVKNFLKLNPPIIPLAVYRMRTDDNVLKNEYPYIITNPKKGLDLNRFDKIICIGHPGENIFEGFVYENYFFEEDEGLGRDTLVFEEKNHLFNLKAKKSKNKLLKNNSQAQIKINKHLDENELIEKLKEEIKNFKILTKSNNDIENANSHVNNFKKLKHRSSSFNVIQEENSEYGGNEYNHKEKFESSGDEDYSFVLKKKITEFTTSGIKGNNISEKVDQKKENKNFSIALVEDFAIPGIDIKDYSI